MSTTVESLRHRVDWSPLTVGVAVGDFLLIAAFVALGVSIHGTNPFTSPLAALEAYVPFAVGWLVTSLLGGLYTTDAFRSPKRALAWTVPAWIGAAIIAQALRATAVFGGSAALTFFLVSVGVVLALLVPWRAAVASLTS